MGDVITAIKKVENSADAFLFKVSYTKYVMQENGMLLGEALGVVESNIGYAAGYLDKVDGQRVLDLFKVQHPVFGKNLRDVTPEEAFKLGMKWAARSRCKKSKELK